MRNSSVSAWFCAIFAAVWAAGSPQAARANAPVADPPHEPYPPPGYAADWQPAERTDFALDPTLPLDLDDPAEAHHRGFHLRVSACPSLARVRSVGAPQPTSFSGFSAGLSLAAGAALADDVVVFGEVAAASAIAPRVSSVDGRYPDGTAVTTLGLGGGVAYYFMPSNLNLSAALLISQVRTVDRQRDQLLGRSEIGPALHLQAGKDWPLAGRWALGLSLRAHLAQLEDARERHTAWRSYGLGLALSAIYD
jgi:hypothetical protein